MSQPLVVVERGHVARARPNRGARRIEYVAPRRPLTGVRTVLPALGRSNVLQEFAGGPGQIALHGTAGLAGALGSASSHGCIRLSSGAIGWLARRVGGGVPLTIGS